MVILPLPLLPIAIGVGGAFHVANALWQGYQGQKRINEVNDYVSQLESQGISVKYPRMRGLYTDEVGNWLGAFAGMSYGASSVLGAYSSYKSSLGYVSAPDGVWNPYDSGYY